MAIKIAVAGNQNSGKTTLFNALTGSNQYVGNWPGVTVEKKEGRLKGHKDVILMDLPGIYSLSPYTMEEVISRNYVVHERPDAILNIVDGTNLERNLYLTTQLCELGIPVVIAVNMMDVVRKNGDKLNLKKMQEVLGCPVVEISALKKEGIDTAAELVVQKAREGLPHPIQHRYSEDLETALTQIEGMLGSEVPESQRRFFAVKLFERDSKIGDYLKTVPDVEPIITALEQKLENDAESIVVNARYTFIESVISSFYTHKIQRTSTVSDKIDRVLTNRWAALPIFAAIVFLIYFIAVTTVGTIVTDWMNDGVFGDGWYLLGIGQGNYEEASADYEAQQALIDGYLSGAVEANVPGAEAAQAALLLDTESFESEEEAAAAESVAAADLVTFTENAEKQNYIGEASLIVDEDSQEAVYPEIVNPVTQETVDPQAVTASDFAAALTVTEPSPYDYGPYIPGIPVLLESGLDAIHCVDWLKSLILDGIVAGVGAVLGFVPQIMVLFFLLAILEGCGYMARVAFILDRIFRKFGLSGKSFIPMLIGTGCGVPAIMASRTIEREQDRRMTVMTTTFMPCSAKLPIIATIAGACFGNAGWVAAVTYFIGIAAIIVSGIMLKKTRPFSGKPSPFVLELPAYHIPTVGSVLRSTWERGWSFIKKAGTIILASTVVIWFLTNFGWTEAGFGLVGEQADGSILAYIGRGICWIFVPLGWGSTWEPSVATFTGFVAKENVVGTLGAIFASEGYTSTWAGMAAVLPSGLIAFSFMLFNLLCAPCFAAMGAMKREMNNARWTFFAIAYQMVFGYVVAMIVFRLGTLFSGGGYDIIWTTVAILLCALMLFLLFRPQPKHELRQHKNKKPQNVSTEAR